MKLFCKITATVLAVAFLFSCNQKETGKNAPTTVPSLFLIKKEIEVEYIGEIRTRRTFAGIQFMDDEKEQDKYIAEQEKSNPWVYDFSPKDSILIKQFERLGMIKNEGFLLENFKAETNRVTSFTDRAKRVYSIKFFNDSLSEHIHFKIFFSKDSIEIDTQATPLQDLDYAFIDIIPGGNKELVFLDDYYIMNGYNFDFKVYEIKSN